ncbi:MAG: hypothetical protein K1X66_01120 [Verrucomicrobiae bacterium]|nr:hypothetical protein [Verrucomicrobiae bacterium]
MDSRIELKRVLEELMESIRKHENCLSHLSKLDRLVKETNWDPQLTHFLEKRSYEKALSFLRSEEVARGSCGK